MIETKFKETELGRIPEDWEVYALGELGEPRMCKRIMKYQTNDVHGIPFYKIGTFGKCADSYISPDLWRKLSNTYNYPRKGDVLISAAGTIGRAVVFDGTPSYFQDSNIVWIDNSEKQVSNRLLVFLISSIKWSTDASTISRLYNHNLKAALVKAPDNPFEQTQIAEALSDVDALIAEMDVLIEKKRAIMTATMQGLLTARRRLPGFSEPWRTVQLKELAKMQSGGTPSTSILSYYTGNIPFLGIGDMTVSKKYLHATQKHITKEAVENSSARIFPAGTFLMSMYASIGKCVISSIDVAISQAILGFYSLSPEIDKDFLYYKLSLFSRDLATSGQTGTQSNLKKQIVQNYTVSIPRCVEEQQAIASILSDMDAEIVELEAKRDKYVAIRQGMMQQLLTGKIRLI